MNAPAVPSGIAADVPADVLAWWQAAQRPCVLSGAGMSAESGVPTFRDTPQSLWARFNPETLATAAAFERDPPLVWAWYQWRAHLVRQAQPNAGHVALARWARHRSGLRIVTQNVDDLHERAGSPDVIHVHGSLFAPRCFTCGRPPPEPVAPQAEDWHPQLRITPPACPHCAGPLRPGVVWFGEALPQGPWQAALDAVATCDLLLVVGTSGLVHPAAGLPAQALARGVPVVEINPQPTPLSGQVSRVWRTTAAVGLPALVGDVGGSTRA